MLQAQLSLRTVSSSLVSISTDKSLHHQINIVSPPSNLLVFSSSSSSSFPATFHSAIRRTRFNLYHLSPSNSSRRPVFTVRSSNADHFDRDLDDFVEATLLLPGIIYLKLLSFWILSELLKFRRFNRFSMYLFPFVVVATVFFSLFEKLFY